MGSVWLTFWAALLVGLSVGCGTRVGGDPELLVFAAASLNDALTEIGRSFEEDADAGVVFSFGGSQVLARQIANGAPADVFISAGELPVQFLAERELIEPHVVNLLTNKLVVVANPDRAQPESIEQLTTDVVERLAVASPEMAPAGWYARESLTRLGIWDDLQRKLIIGADVRATLVYVETGNADAAVVYQTDAMTSRNLSILDIVPTDSYPQIVYPAIVVSGSEEKALAGEFLGFLRSETAAAIFLRHGFRTLMP